MDDFLQTNSPKRRLFLRLSSLGDVVLASTALEIKVSSQNLLEGPFETHWVVAEEYSILLKEHPGIHHLWSFDRKTGFAGWLKLCEQLRAQNFQEIFDLHGSLRTKILRIYLLVFHRVKYHWKTVPKRRLKLWGMYFFKQKWRKHPEPIVVKIARFVGGTGEERPCLKHLVKESPIFPFISEKGLSLKKYICIMPDSLWPAKRWSTSKFLEVAQLSPYLPVILGAAKDQCSLQLVSYLKKAGVPHISGIGIWNLQQVATVLAGAEMYLGNDTGLGHIAEAVGTTAHFIFGPTVPEMGFGPWLEKSSTLGAELWCRPCGKDGRYCFRILNPHLCIKSVPSVQVATRIFGPLKEDKSVL